MWKRGEREGKGRSRVRKEEKEYAEEKRMIRTRTIRRKERRREEECNIRGTRHYRQTVTYCCAVS